jgi:AraC-like DNA-binding protein
VGAANLLAFNIGGHGAACALFLMLACLSWRDGDASLVWRLTAALALCAAANAVVTAPGFFPARYWQAPILALSWGEPALFWLWARAAFDDEFAPRFWHAAPWVALVCGGLLDSYDWGVWPALAQATDAGLQFLQTGLAILAALQTLTTCSADLVMKRRRLRVVVFLSAVAFTIMMTMMDLPWSPLRGSPLVGALRTFSLCALAAMWSWSLLRIAGAARAAVLPATSADAPTTTAEDLRRAADPALLRRLDHLMTTERVYRQEGLTIGALAVKLGAPEYRLRQAINEGLGHRNFNAFLNGYRIRETKAALGDPEQKEVPVLTIAMDAGFQSIGPFNRAFKAETGMTPTEYRRAALCASATDKSLSRQGNLEISKSV